MTDTNSPAFRRTGHLITSALISSYKNNANLISIAVNELRSGSVVSVMTFSFLSTFTNPFAPLKDQLKSGNVGGMTVNASTFTTDRCSHFTCPRDQYCWYNETGAGCACPADHYMSNDGQKCFVDCKEGYCMNGGSCRRSESGRECSCLGKYSGARCEDKDNTHDYALVIGLVLAAVLLLILIGCCLKRRKRASAQVKGEALTDDVEVINGYTENVSTTPIVVRIEHKKETDTLAFVNKAADFDDDEPDNAAPVRQSSKMTVFLKPKSDELEMDVVTGDTHSEKNEETEESKNEVETNNPHMSFI